MSNFTNSCCIALLAVALLVSFTYQNDKRSAVEVKYDLVDQRGVTLGERIARAEQRIQTQEDELFKWRRAAAQRADTKSQEDREVLKVLGLLSNAVNLLHETFDRRLTALEMAQLEMRDTPVPASATSRFGVSVVGTFLGDNIAQYAANYTRNRVRLEEQIFLIPVPDEALRIEIPLD